MAYSGVSHFMKRIVEDRRKSREAMAKIGDEAVGIALKSQYGEAEANNKFQRDYALKQQEQQGQMNIEKKKQAGQTYRLFKSLRSKETIAGAKPAKPELSSGYFQFSESLKSMLEEGAGQNGMYDTTSYPTLMKALGGSDEVSQEELGEALSRYKKTLKGGDAEDFDSIVAPHFPELATGTLTKKPTGSGPTEEAIAFTMKKYKLTRQQVMDRLNGK